MSSVDERIVQMKFENAAFQQGVQQTISSLERLNKSLQLQGAAKGLQGVSAVAQQFDQHMVRTRNSLGQFTTGMQQTSTITQGFSAKMEAGKEKLNQFASGFSSVVSHVSSFGQKIESGRNSLGQFTSGLGSVSGAANNANSSLKNIENGVSTLAGRFTALGTMATGALMDIGSQAASAAARMINSFTFEPILSGFREYETNMNSIQTILANTQSAGTNLRDVTHALDELNHYSDQTIYNFSEMAKNIGTFTAAGVALEPATAAIKGIANLAALSGSNSEQASGAMYQLSQAISAGRVTLEDWNSVVNAGMGGTVFQRALAMNAEKMGTLKDGAVKLTGEMKNVTIGGKSFRESITAKPGQESWLTSKVLTQTLAQFTGDLSDADLAAQGFSKSQIKAIQDQAKMAKSAATEVKTLTQLFGTFKEQMGSGWAQTWQIIFGDFAEAKGLFTGISEGIGGMLQKSAEGRNKMLKDWDALGGRKALIEGVTNVFKALVAVAKPIKDAFREIFPATTGKQLADMTKNFRDFTEKLKIGGDTADKLKRTFAGVFAVFGIAVDIIKGVVGVIFDLIGVATKGSGGFLNFTAKIGDFLVALRKGIQEGEGLKNFFKGLGTVLAIPIKLVQKLAGFLGSLFEDTDSKGVQDSVEGISSKLEPLGRLGDVVSAAWEKTLTVFKNVGEFFQKIGKAISDGASTMGISLSEMFSGFNWDTMFAGLNTGLLAGLFVVIKNFLGGLGGGGGFGELLQNISDGIGDITGAFKGMQNALNAAALLQIAIAVGILAVSLNVLSKIDAEGLTRASTAIAVMFGQLIGAMAVFQKFVGAAGFAKMPFVMGSLILLAAAVLVLAQAVKQLSGLSWNELAKGLTGLAVTLGVLVGALKLMPNTTGLMSTGIALIALGLAIKILASAVTDLSGLSWDELAKGLIGVGALLGSLALFTKFSTVSKGGILQGAGLILLAAGIKILASAVTDMAGLSWNEIAKGLVTLAGSLAVITGALMVIPPTAPLAAAGVLLTAISLGMVAKALQEMATMSWGEIGKSLVVLLGSLALIAAALYVVPPTAPLAAAGILITALALKQLAGTLQGFSEYSWEEIGKAMVMLAGTMGIIAGAMLLMTGAIPGAAATIIIAAALAILAPVLMQFSQMSLGEVGTALLMLAGVFVVFGAAALLLTPVVPMMILLAAAVALLGVGVLAAGAGVLLFATGLTALAAAGAAGTAALVAMVTALASLIPEVMKQVGLGIVAFAGVIAVSGPAITKALVTVLNSLIDAVVKVTPKIIDAMYKLLSKLLSTMQKYVPNMVDAGMKILAGFLRGIANNIGDVVDEAVRVVTNFINGVARNIPKIIQSGVNLILKFINGLTTAIDKNSETLGAAGGRLAVAIVKGMVKGIGAGIGEVRDAAMRLARSALDSAKNFLGIHSPSKEFEKVGNYVNDGFKKGLDGNKSQIDSAFKDMGTKLKALSKSAKATAKERSRALSAYNYLTKSLDDEHAKLASLSGVYDTYTKKITDANTALENAKKTRDDYNKSISDQYSDQATPTADISVADFTENLRKQIENTKVFANGLARLRAMGLNDELYKDLLAAGPDSLPFVQNLLDAGPDAVKELRSLAGQLNTAGAALGKQASTDLYQAAVNSAQGFVDGLKKQQAAIEKQMDTIAAAMIKAIKKKLGIKSPSREFMKVGDYSAQGLINGLVKMTANVEKAAEDTGSAAVDSLRKSLSGFSDLVTSDVDLQPVITPVLDLSSVKKDAGSINGIIPSGSVSIDSAYSKAAYVAAGYARNQAASAQNADREIAPSVTFNQTNNSPKALSSAEIYRQTNNQLSVAKGALTTTR